MTSEPSSDHGPDQPSVDAPTEGSLRRCDERDRTGILEIINAAALAYRGVIPADRWHEPYMSVAELDAELVAGPVLVGTWAAAEWAIAFHRGHGFVQVSDQDKTRLLQRYGTVPERQIETSVVLTRALERRPPSSAT